MAWRNANGPFKSADDLSQVKGIGKSTLERNRTAILLADAPPAAAAAPAAKADTPEKKVRRTSKKVPATVEK